MQQNISLSQKNKNGRTIDFPFLIIKQKVSAAFTNGILEIFISKTEKEHEKTGLLPCLKFLLF